MDELVERQMIALLPRLRRFARSITGSVADGDDLVQQTCERAILNIDKWQPGTRLDSWMYRIAQNLDRSARRRAGTHARVIAEVAEEAACVPFATTGAQVTLDDVRRAFDHLQSDHRSVLMLVTVEGYSYSEAADILSVPVGTVMSRLSRARAALRAVLEGGPESGAPESRAAAAP